jgi:serine/threonine protein kinase/tetratricopeptide (TPR) repeat protein
LAVVDFGEASTSMRNTPQGRARFGVFELDLKAGELHKDGQTVLLQEQPLQVLRMLVVRAGGLVTREEIQKKLWPNDTVVEFDHGINTAIQKLRQALGDSADKPSYIQTVARRGYRLVVPVERLDTPADAASESGIVSSSGDGTGEQLKLEPAALTGKTVSHYRVLGIVGGGGMGVVYKAEDLKLGRAVALKFLPEEVDSDPRALERFQREARTASSLNHPNICTIYEIEEHDGRPFIAMELLEGRTLRDRLVAATLAAEPLSIDQVLSVALQILEGLEAAHEKDIIHRDIKPANIFITNKGVTKILDFGLAKLLQPSGGQAIAPEIDGRPGLPIAAAAGSETVDLSRAGAAVGTAAYMSPEQVRGEKLDARTDLFSFGVVLYEMTTGWRGFTGDTTESLPDAIPNRTPTPPAKLNPDLSTELQDVIQRCLERDRNLRYQSAAAIRSHLERIWRETQQPYLRRRWKLLATAALVVVVLITGGLYWHLRRIPTLTEKDTIVLANFTNTTGDKVFDDTLRQALRIQLEQSPFLDLISESKVNETLQLMGRSAGERATPELMREVCQRTSSKAMLEGSIAALGSQYVIGLKAVNCSTGDLLAEAQEQATGKETILKALHNAAVSVRSELGESLNSVQKYTTPLEYASTTSLEALQAYSLGVKTAAAKGDAAAVPFFQRATERDPNFAMAYLRLATAYYNVNEASLASETAGKAYRLRERVSELERLHIDSVYYHINGDLEKAAKVYELWLQTYPREYAPYQNLGLIHTELGQYEKALTEFREVRRLEPKRVSSYSNLAAVYRMLNRPEEAGEVLEQAQALKLNAPELGSFLYDLAFLRGDVGGMERQVKAAMGQPGTEDELLATQADTEAYHGRLRKSREFTHRAIESARRNGDEETAAGYEVVAALREGEFGNAELGRQEAGMAMAMAPGLQVKTLAALTLARATERKRALALADDLNRKYPSATLLQDYWLPTVRAAVELDRHNPAIAVDLLKPAELYELGTPSTPTNNVYPYPVYVRGEAYLLAREGSRAAAEFQKILDHPGVVVNSPLGALAHLGMGRAYALDAATDPAARDKARTAYQDFLTLWKDADPDIPIYKQAKAEYARLR